MVFIRLQLIAVLCELHSAHCIIVCSTRIYEYMVLPLFYSTAFRTAETKLFQLRCQAFVWSNYCGLVLHTHARNRRFAVALVDWVRDMVSRLLGFLLWEPSASLASPNAIQNFAFLVCHEEKRGKEMEQYFNGRDVMSQCRWGWAKNLFIFEGERTCKQESLRIGSR